MNAGTLMLPTSFDFDRGVAGIGSPTGSDIQHLGGYGTPVVLIAWPTQTKARLQPLGIFDFDSIGFDDAKQYAYAGTRLESEAQLGEGCVFLVLTRSGGYAKVKVLRFDAYSDDLYVHWEKLLPPVAYLDLQVTLGSAPTWLLTSYSAACTYTGPAGIVTCGNGVFGPEGGLIQDRVSDEGGGFPVSVNVTVTMDFVPDTQLPGVVKSFAAEVENTGVNFFFEPYQVLQKTDFLFDLQPSPLANDYVLLRWKHIVAGQVVTSGQHSLSGSELRQQALTQYEVVFVPDPIAAKEMIVQMDGRYQDAPLPPFTGTFQLSEKAVIVQSRQADSGPGYVLVTL